MIVDKIFPSDLDTTVLDATLDHKWLKFKESILNIIDDIAPEKLITIKNDIDFPWIDVELIEAKLVRDHSYAQSISSKSDNDFNIYAENRKFYQRLNKDKMINYFKECSAKDIKNSKKFWKLYSSFIKIKSNKDTSTSSIINNGTSSSNKPSAICLTFSLQRCLRRQLPHRRIALILLISISLKQ